MAVPARRSAAQDADAASDVRTFLIADIRGYTSFTQARGDAAAAALAARFAGIAREAVAARGGEVVELRGDEVLAVFASARQAIRAAAELQAALAEEAVASPDLPLLAGIGLDAGEAIPVEGGFRGAALNLAARLCAKAGPGETLASDGVVHLARAVGGVRFEEVGAETFKGIDAPVRVVRVIGTTPPAGARPAVPPPELPGDLDTALLPLAGRDPVTWWLRGSWRLTRRGLGRLLAISGPAGMGKTRLAMELARSVHEDGFAVAYVPLEQDPGGLERLLGELGSGRSPSGEPGLVVVDDLDLAEPAALARLARLASEGIPLPTLILATCRDDVPSPALGELLARLDAVDAHRALGPIDADAVLEIVAGYSARPRQDVPVAAILEASDGVPGQVHDLAAQWARTEASRRLGSVVTRASTGRRELRAIEAELADNVIDLQRIRDRSRLRSTAAVVGEAVCPFKGLSPFEAADADLFFGRERLIAELIARLVGATFLGVVGPSGSGKSSVLRAGLLPALAAGVLPGSEGWRQVLFRPGTRPMAALRRALEVEGDADPVPAALAGVAADERIVVAIDQFEEIFTACEDEDERAAFVEAAVRLAGDPDHRAKVVTALRADFYGRCAIFPELADLLATGNVLVGPMHADEFRQVIERPSQLAGLRVEPELVEALVADVVDEPGALPLLSTALLELWSRRDGRTLRMTTYEQTGGVRGAVARMAEDAYGHLDAHGQTVARAVLLRLANEDETRAVARRRAPLAEFDTADATVADVIASLTARRLLTVDEGSLEVAHDALFLEWPRLAGWLDEDAQGRSLRRHVTVAAAEWDAAGRDPGELYRGARLATALDWTADHDVELNQLEREFLAESRAASEREADRVRRTNRRLRILLAASVAALAIAVVAGGYAVGQQRQAEEAAAAAETQRQAAEARKAEAEHAALVADAQRIGAQALTEDAIDVSLLLAREAVALDDSIETRSSLLAALQRAPAAIAVLHGTDYQKTWVDITPDGSVVMAGDKLGGVSFFDTATNESLTASAQLGAAVFGHDVSPDGQWLAGIAPDIPPNDSILGLVRVADRFIDTTVRIQGALGALLYTPDGASLLTLEDDGAAGPGRWLVFRDVETGQPTGRSIQVAGGDGDVVLAAIGPQRIAYAFRPRTASEGRPYTQIVDLGQGRVVGELPLSGPLAASPDGRSLAIGGEDGRITFVDLATGRRDTTVDGHRAEVSGLAFTPDGQTLVSVGFDRDVLVWDVSTRTVREILRGHSGAVFGPAISPDGKTAYTASSDGTIVVWDLAGTRRFAVPFSLGADAAPYPIHFATVAGDDRTLVYAMAGGRVRLHDLGGRRPDRDIDVWDAASVEEVLTAMPGERDRAPTGELIEVAAQPGGTLVAITSDLPVPVLLDTATGVVRRLSDGHTSGFTLGAAFSADGSRLATGGDDHQVVIWDVGTGRPEDHLRLAGAYGNALAFSPDGGTLAVGQTGDVVFGSALLWDLATHAPVGQIGVDEYVPNSVRFTADGRRLVAAAGFSGQVRIFDVETGQQIGTPLSAHAGDTLDAVVDPAGRFLASAGTDGVARLWDLAKGQPLGTPMRAQEGLVRESRNAVAILSDGSRLVQVDDRGFGTIWPLDESVWQADACKVAGRTLTQPELNAFLPGSTAPVGCTD